MNVIYERDGFSVALAGTEADVQAAQALRHAVFVQELGAPDQGGLERDRFDPFCDHLVLRQGADVVGTTRVMDGAQAGAAGGFYSEGEFDLAPLKVSGLGLLEIGRTCLRADQRGGAGMFHLWSALARFVTQKGAGVMFGTASLPGCDLAAHGAALSLLKARHLAPDRLRARSVQGGFEVACDIDRAAVVKSLPALIKAYLRLGGVVGEGAFVDRAFNCTDVLMILEIAAMDDRQARMYRG